MKEIFGSIFIIFISIFGGYVYSNHILGTILLSNSLLNIWLATLNNRYNYIFGSIFYIFNAYISYINGLFGLAFLSIFIYLPLQIDGFIRWMDDNTIKSLPKRTYLITIICIITSTTCFSILLNMIPTQSLELLDASSNITNICGIILMNLKYKEAWKIWLINNIIDLIIWILKAIYNTPYALIMLIVSIGYLLLNIYGLRKWKS